MAPKVKAVIFDIFGTLVDWRGSIAAEIGKSLSLKGIKLDPFELADAWRGEYQPAMDRVRSGKRGYVPLDDLHLENLGVVLKRFALENRFDLAERMALNSAWERLQPWPDTVPGLMQLRKTHIVAPCSNGSIALMTRLARFGGLHFDAILGADIARSYKPRPEVYLRSAAALRLEPGQVMMVAAHNEDLEAAAACGLKTAFIARPLEYGPARAHEAEPSGNWDIVCTDVGNLADRLPDRI